MCSQWDASNQVNKTQRIILLYPRRQEYKLRSLKDTMDIIFLRWCRYERQDYPFFNSAVFWKTTGKLFFSAVFGKTVALFLEFYRFPKKQRKKFIFFLPFTPTPWISYFYDGASMNGRITLFLIPLFFGKRQENFSFLLSLEKQWLYF